MIERCFSSLRYVPSGSRVPVDRLSILVVERMTRNVVWGVVYLLATYDTVVYAVLSIGDDGNSRESI